MNDIEIKLLNAKLYLNYYKNNNILDRYATIIERLVIDNDCLSVLKNPNEKLYITPLSKNVNKEEKYKDLEQILELTSKSLDNISYDQIPIAIEELKFKLQDLEQIEKEHKEENGRLREELDKKNETEKLRYYKRGFYAGVECFENRLRENLESLKKDYKEALEENSTKAFILKCQIEILQELLEESEK